MIHLEWIVVKTSMCHMPLVFECIHGLDDDIIESWWNFLKYAKEGV